MVKLLKDLAQDVYGLLEGNSLADPALFEKYRSLIGDVIVSRLQTEKREPNLRMSSIGKPLRQLWYELNGYKGETLEGKTLVKFAYGHLVEALILILAEASGHTVERLQEKIEVDSIVGHIDCVLDGVLVDVKSASPYSFQKFKDGTLLNEGNDPFGYIGQLSGYAQALNLPAAWIAINKVSGEVCVLDLPKECTEAYDIRTRIELVRSTIKQETPPERCYPDEPDGKSGNRKLSVGCSYCPHKLECWKDVNNGKGLDVYYYSTGPRYLTNVTRTPKVFSIKNESINIV